MILSNSTRLGKPVGVRDAGSFWHSDRSYMERTADAIVLYSVEVPEVGGDTHFADLSLMLEHASLTLKAEPGCEQFDVLDPQDDSPSVFLYERYRDDATLQEHMNPALLASTRGSYDDMITKKTGRALRGCPRVTDWPARATPR